jgi:hypothetical protein
MTSDIDLFVPGGRTVVGDEPFSFHCHPDVSCYLTCCHKVEMYLYPYDVLRMKNRLGMDSAKFMYTHSRISEGSHPYFPAVMLNMTGKEGYPCPFLKDSGCSIYKDRPSACRTYPLERAVQFSPETGTIDDHYFITNHSYCRGHREKRSYTVIEWERDQLLTEYNTLNGLWAEVDAFFSTNPWQGEGVAGPYQQLAFMVCYNIDEFRSYLNRHNLLASFCLSKQERRRIKRDDTELLKFGFKWLQFILGERDTLMVR